MRKSELVGAVVSVTMLAFLLRFDLVRHYVGLGIDFISSEAGKGNPLIFGCLGGLFLITLGIVAYEANKNL